jgi:ABC-type amino acid transport substrate-binding protein
VDQPCTRRLLALAAAAAALACDMPRDAESTLERVRDTGVLRAGAVSNPPFVVTTSGGGVSGPEAAVVEAFAKAHGAAVTWVVASEEELVERLERFQLDVVVGGITRKNPLAKKVGATLPLYERAGKQHVLLTPPGENGLLLALDRAVYPQRERLQRSLGGTTP